MARRMIFGAQDPIRIVDLDHLVVLISFATTVDINSRRDLIDDLWGLVRELWRLVSRVHKLRRRIIKGSLWRRIELCNHLPSPLPKQRQVLLGLFMPNIIHKFLDTFIIIISIDLLELG